MIRAGFRDLNANYASGYTIYFAYSPGLIRLMVSSPFRTPVESRRAVASLLLGFNWAQQEGAAEMDIKDGELRLRSAFPILGASASEVKATCQILLAGASRYSNLAKAVCGLSESVAQGTEPDATVIKIFVERSVHGDGDDDDSN